MTRTVGIRSLKNETSRLVRAVEDGESIVITRNGHAVARLVPEGMPAGIEGLVESGVAAWTGKQVSVPPAAGSIPTGAATLADTVLADRGER